MACAVSARDQHQTTGAVASAGARENPRREGVYVMAVILFKGFKLKQESIAVAQFSLMHGGYSVVWNAQLWKHNPMQQQGNGKLDPYVTQLKAALLQWGKLW